VAFSWVEGEDSFLIVVNYGPNQGQCYVGLDDAILVEQRLALSDLLSDERYERDGTELASRGLYVDMPAYGRHIFALEQVGSRVVTAS
jgi:hypothetical protein